jgi:hypothetical protein
VDLIQFKIFHVDNNQQKIVTEDVLQHLVIVLDLQFKDVEQYQHLLEQLVELSFKTIAPKDAIHVKVKIVMIKLLVQKIVVM